MSIEDAKGSGLSWFIRRGAAVRGPFSSARVRHLVLEGTLELDDEVSADRRAWERVADVPEVVPMQMRVGDDVFADDEADRQRGEHRRAVRATIVAVVVIAAFVVTVSLVGTGRDQAQRDCTNTPAPGVFLEGCDMSRAQWVGASLSEARLANIKLGGANLSTADLQNADLRYADLKGADLSYARLGSAVLLGAALRHADLTNADLSGADVSFADLTGARLGGARVDNANFNGAIWTDGIRCGAADCPR